MTATKVAEIADRSACAVWCPFESHPDVVAVASKDSGGIGFEDTGGELELFDLKLSSSEAPQLLAKLQTNEKFASVDWSTYTANGQYPLGLIAGGLTDGVVHIWDVSAFLSGESAPIFTLNQQQPQHHAQGPVAALQFHPLQPWNLATGGSDGKVIIVNLAQIEQQPSVVDLSLSGSKQGAAITAVAWNSQVEHILASSSRDGTVVVWDVKQHKSWCKLQVEHGGVSDVAWNPREGLYLLTASADDRNPVIKVWDLGASTTLPLTTLPGHTAGILKTSWCPHDDGLLLSCAKDNRTLLWDLVTLRPVAELPLDMDGATSPDRNPKSSPNQLFASSSLNEQKHMRVFAAWSPLKRGLALTCSLDRKIQVHSVLGLATLSGRPPKWMRPQSAVTTGFGGTVVSLDCKSTVVTIQTVQEQPQLVLLSNEFETELATSNVVDFCERKRAKAPIGSNEAKCWSFMKVIFAPDARQQLLRELGFDANEIAEAARNFSKEDVSNGVGAITLDDKSSSTMDPFAADIVKKALLVGNFEAAVECCFLAGNLADALLLASCGGAELWSKTQERYFEEQSSKRPFLGLLNGIIRCQLDDVVAQSDTACWQETLAILATYAQSEEFPRLCISLGERLVASIDPANASLCFMCSLSAEHATGYWKAQYDKANKAKGSLDIFALHELVMKVSVFMQAAGSKTALPTDIAEVFTTYAQALAEQGHLVTSAKYCKGTSEASKILRDRLYRSKDSQRCLVELGSAPEFPFTVTTVAQSRQQTSVASKNLHAHTTQRQQPQSTASYGGKQAYTSADVAPTSQPHVSGGLLPSGWMELQDPASGRIYYANQTTGETTWERPSASLVSLTPPTTSGQLDSSGRSQQTSSATPGKVVSKYGDGFVTSSSHPELASQYGNHGTSNPYSASRPGTAAAVVKSANALPGSAPPSGPIDLASADFSSEQRQIVDTLLSLHDYLVSVALPPEKRQLDEAKTAIDALGKKFVRGGVDHDIESKLVSMATAMSSRDFRTATAIQTALVNHDWKVHKDWLKGLKLLIQLGTKKVV